MPRTERSSESAAAIAVSRTAASATETAIGPAVSWTGDSGTMPVLLTRPAVGLMPTTPQALDGETIDPSVSVPTATAASPAETPAPHPALEPGGVRARA